MQLVKIENLYRNIFTQVSVTGAEQIQDDHVPQSVDSRKYLVQNPSYNFRGLQPFVLEALNN